ncbi:MAG: DUF1906 domain-containing protein, partial [Actinomycetota bacterium]|nr:DUF1906 domain-containing protein [Actinomycetota bacterium]
PPGAALAARPVPPARPGVQLATRPQLFAGLDRMVMPDGPRARGPLWLGLLFQATTFRVAGAYLEFSAQRHWHDNVAAVRDQGWGIAGIYLGFSRNSFRHTETSTVMKDGQPTKVERRVMSAAEQVRWRAEMVGSRGTADAQEAKRLAASAGTLPGSVVWFDNEDESDIVFEQHELEYYAAFLTELGVARSGEPAYRAGLYAHQTIAAQVLARQPEVWIWEVDYGNNVNRTSMPPLRVPTRSDARFGLAPANQDAVVKSFRVVPPAGVAGAPWGCWPAWRQWQGNNNVDLPQSARDALTPVKKWDWNSSLVRDPEDPQPTPRLAVAAGGPAAWVARVDDLDPELTAGRRTRPRRGRLTMWLPVAGARSVEVLPERGWEIHPSSGIVPVVGAGAAEMVVVFTLNELGSTVWDARQWGPVKPLWNLSLTASPRLPHALAAAAPSPLDLHLVWAATGQGLWTARRPVAGRWGDPARLGGDLKLHPFSRVAAAPAGGGMHVLAVDNTGRLVHASWAPPASWPASAATPIGGDRILPGADLLLAAGDPGTVIAVAVGTDLQLRRWVLRLGPTARWSPSAPLGQPTDTVHPHTRLGSARSLTGGIVVSAVDGGGVVLRFLLDAGGGWVTPSAIRVPAQPGAAAIHPLSDLSSLPNGRLVVATISPGEPAAALLDPASGNAAPLI